MSNRIRNFLTALKQFQSTHPWAAPGFRTMDGGLRTLDPGHWTSDAGRGGLRHVAEQPSSGPNWKHQKLGVARGLGWIQLKTKNKKKRESQEQAMDQMLPVSGSGSGSACVAAAVVAVHGERPPKKR